MKLVRQLNGKAITAMILFSLSMVKSQMRRNIDPVGMLTSMRNVDVEATLRIATVVRRSRGKFDY